MGWRKANNQAQRLLGHIKPFKLAGIDADTFKAHSRIATISKADATGFALDETLEKGSWYKWFTWQRFYKKDIISTAVATFLWDKNLELLKGAKRPQSNFDFMNKI